MESKQMQTCSIRWNYFSYKAGVFLCKISPHTEHHWHCTIVFFLFYFFVKNILFSSVYISVNTIFQCCYLFFGWEIGHLLSTCATEGTERVIQNVYRCIQGERSITPPVYLPTYRQCWHTYHSCFYLKMSCPSLL